MRNRTEKPSAAPGCIRTGCPGASSDRIAIGARFALDTPFGSGVECLSFVVVAIDGDTLTAEHRCSGGWKIDARVRVSDVRRNRLFCWYHAGNRLLRPRKRDAWRVQVPA